MAKINLLPWREELRKQQQKDFLSAIGAGVAVTALSLVMVHMYFSGQIENQTQRNSYLQAEVAVLDKKIAEIRNLEKTKRRLVSKMDVIQKLQGSRPGIVHLFDEIAKSVPDGVYLKNLVQSGKKLKLVGVAQSNARVSAYMRDLEASPWIAGPRLQIIETKGKSKHSRVSNFTLSVIQTQKDSKIDSKKKAG
ncbi:MAG: PilN domain-containing protein [Methylococcales bacterium]